MLKDNNLICISLHFWTYKISSFKLFSSHFPHQADKWPNKALWQERIQSHVVAAWKYGKLINSSTKEKVMRIKNEFYGTMTYKMTKLVTLNALCVILLAEDYNYVKLLILLTLFVFI